MGLVNFLQQGFNSLFGQFGVGVQVFTLIVGLILLVVAYALVRRAEDARGIGGGSGARIGAAVLATVGVPIILASVGVGATDALLWALITLIVASFWVASGSGKVSKIIGIAVGIIAVITVIGLSRSAPTGSVVASGVNTVTDQFGQLWSTLFNHK